MNIVGECTIQAPREIVWAAINRVDLLRTSIPGCQELLEDDEGRLKAIVKLKIGPVSATLKGCVTLHDINPPFSYVIVGEGEGGIAGFVQGRSQVTLEEISSSITKLSFDAQTKVGGKLASVGGRLLNATAHKLANLFFENFHAALISEGLAKPLEAPASQSLP